MSYAPIIAQSDKEIIKEANEDIKNSNFEQAFSKIITVSKPENSKVQDVLKETYANLIADYISKATAIKVSDKDSLQVKHDKIIEIIGYLNDANATDSIFKKLAKPDLYKSLSKKKKVESTLSKYNKTLKSVDDAIAKRNAPAVTADTAKTDNSTVVMPNDTASNATSANTNTAQETNATNTNSSNVANTSSANVTNNTATGNSGEKKFYIIAGSYKSEADAQTAVNSLKALGYNAAEIVGQNAYGNFRICYSSFASKVDAQTELEKIKSSVQADAWILEK